MAKIWFGRQAIVVHTDRVIDIDHIVQKSALVVPEPLDECRLGVRRERAAHRADRRPAMRRALIHSACTSTGFPNRGVTTAVADLRVHPGQLDAGLASGEQPCRLPECRSGFHGRSRLRSRRSPSSRLSAVQCAERPFRLGRLQKLVYGNDVPERGVDRVVSGTRPASGKVRQHAVAHVLRPLEQDVARVGEPVMLGGSPERHSPRIAMNVSRPQSENHGYPR